MTTGQAPGKAEPAAYGDTPTSAPVIGAAQRAAYGISAGQVMVVEERLTPQGPNIHANKAGYEEIADAFEAIVEPQQEPLGYSDWGC